MIFRRGCYDGPDKSQIPHCSQDVTTLHNIVSRMKIGETHLQFDKSAGNGNFCTCFKQKCNSVSLKQLESSLNAERMTPTSKDISMSTAIALSTESLMDTSDDEKSTYTSTSSRDTHTATMESRYVHTVNINTTFTMSHIEGKMGKITFADVTEDMVLASTRNETFKITKSQANMASKFMLCNNIIISTVFALTCVLY